MRDEQVDAEIVRYPTAEALGYDALLERIVVPNGELALIAESFSGPLAIRLAASLGDRLRALVLVATFARSPTWFARPGSLLGSALFRVPPPRAALRMFLLDENAPATQVDELQRAIATVSPAVLSKRLRAIATVDVRSDLARVRCPTLYLRGARDRVVGAAALATIQRVLPTVSVETIDAPHLVLQLAPERCAHLVSAFIRSAAVRSRVRAL